MIFEYLPSKRCLWKSKLPYFLLIRKKNKITVKIDKKNSLVLFFFKHSYKIAIKKCAAIIYGKMKMNDFTHVGEGWSL